MKLLIFARHFSPAVKAGGPARSLTNLVRTLDTEVTISVVASDRDLGDESPFPGLSGRRIRKGNATIFYLHPGSGRQVASLIRALARSRYDLIMINSIWDVPFALAPAVLKMLGVLKGPLLVMPRGELEDGALALKALKKRAAGPLFNGVYRRAADVFAVTSDKEAGNTHRFFPETPVVRTSNVPDSISLGTPDSPSPALRVTYFSRISPEKGLLQLLRALRHTAAQMELTIAGPVQDEDYWNQCRLALSELPPTIRTRILPFVDRHEVPSLLWNSDCLVLLTPAENYGHVIAEALQAGCPVITTRHTPWTDAISATGGGDIVENRDDAHQVAAVLNVWSNKNQDELEASRQAARAAFDAFTSRTASDVISLALNALRPDPASPGD